jgi:hypothetical protein
LIRRIRAALPDRYSDRPLAITRPAASSLTNVQDDGSVYRTYGCLKPDLHRSCIKHDRNPLEVAFIEPKHAHNVVLLDEGPWTMLM